MAAQTNPQEEIDPRFLQIEPKEDSPEKLSYVAGKLTKFFLFATEFELIRNFVNLLRLDLDARSRNYSVISGFFGPVVPTVGDILTPTFDKDEISTANEPIVIINYESGKLRMRHSMFSNNRVRVYLSFQNPNSKVLHYLDGSDVFIFGFNTANNVFNQNALSNITFEIRVYDEVIIP